MSLPGLTNAQYFGHKRVASLCMSCLKTSNWMCFLDLYSLLFLLLFFIGGVSSQMEMEEYNRIGDALEDLANQSVY